MNLKAICYYRICSSAHLVADVSNLAVDNPRALTLMPPTCHTLAAALPSYKESQQQSVWTWPASRAQAWTQEGAAYHGHLLQRDTLRVIQADLLLYVVGRHQAPVDLQVDGHQKQSLGKQVYLPSVSHFYLLWFNKQAVGSIRTL